MAKKSLMVRDGYRGMVPSRENGYKDKVYGEYLTTLNPRENTHVQMALAECSDVRFTEFLERIMSGRYRRVSLQTIAKACGIGLTDFADWYQKASTQRAIATAQIRSSRIAEDMATDAESTTTACPRCDGLKFVAAPAGLPVDTCGYRMIEKGGMGYEEKWIRDCPVCDGSGKSRKPGDAHARDRILEMSGIIQRGKSAVQIVQNFGGAAHSSAVQDLDSAMTIDVSAIQD